MYGDAERILDEVTSNDWAVDAKQNTDGFGSLLYELVECEAS